MRGESGSLDKSSSDACLKSVQETPGREEVEIASVATPEQVQLRTRRKLKTMLPGRIVFPSSWIRVQNGTPFLGMIPFFSSPESHVCGLVFGNTNVKGL